MMKNMRLIQLREAANLTQEQLAEAIGVSQSMIARVEAGTREPKRAIKIALAKHLNASVEWLFYEQINDHESLTSLNQPTGGDAA